MEKKTLYCFITDENNKFYRATQGPDGTYSIPSPNSVPYPIYWNPTNLVGGLFEFATNKNYFSVVRSIAEPLDYIKDGAAILRHLYFLWKGTESKAYLTVIQWNGETGLYELSYQGKFDFSEKKEDPKSGQFSIPTVDDSCWGVLSQRDDIEFSIDCSATNPKAIRVLLDGLTLVNRITYQTIKARFSQVGVTDGNISSTYSFPTAIINQDGDSYEIVVKNSSFQRAGISQQDLEKSELWFLHTLRAINGVNIQGSISYSAFYDTSGVPIYVTDNFGFTIFIRTSTGQYFQIDSKKLPLIQGRIFVASFDFTLNLAVDEKVYWGINFRTQPNVKIDIDLLQENSFVSLKTRLDSVVVYALRPLDLAQEIVSKATDNRFTISSDYFANNNKNVLLSGDSIRGVQNAKIVTSWRSFFKSFDALQFMALKSVLGQLWMEKATTVYNTDGAIVFTVVVLSSNPTNFTILRFFDYTVNVGDTIKILKTGTLISFTGTVINISDNGIDVNITIIPSSITPIPQTITDMTVIVNGVVIVKNIILQDIGEAIDLQLVPAKEYFANEILVGSPNQDYRHPSGRLEFNSTNRFSLPMQNSKNKLEYISVYRTDGFGITFLLLDYLGNSTKDNSGDNQTFIVDITDEVAYGQDDIETFENVTINHAALAPIIKSPLTNDYITNDVPVIRGIANPFDTVNIYADSIFDGSVIADAGGNWSYNIVTPLSSYSVGVDSGVHIIEATFTDLSAPKTSISITVDTTVTTDTAIIYPNNGDYLFNIKPLIKGVSQAGQNIDIFLNGSAIPLGSVVTDASCKWEYKLNSLQSLPQGTNTITVVGGVGDSAVFTVDSNISHPLITYIGSELDGFNVINNLPLIRGMAQPFEIVTLWLNYVSYSPIGIVQADSLGNWEYQTIPVSYLDPNTGVPAILVPIQNGVNIISTSLINYTVPIVVQGFKLNRPNYSSIEGVTDNTVFNTMLSPKHMLEAHYPMLASIMNQQRRDSILFQTSNKNRTLRTVLNGIVTDEDADIQGSVLGDPIAILEIANIKVRTQTSFAKSLENFNSGGLIKTSFRGTDLFLMPIGSMKMNTITNEVQEWSLLVSPKTSYQSLLNLYKNGLTIKLNQFEMYHSDYNSLHFVTYNHQQSIKYVHIPIYDDRFVNRNESWLNNPPYIQKFQKSEIIRDQLISNGVSTAVLRMYNSFDASLIASFNYAPVNPAPVPLPDVVIETTIDFSPYEGQFFFVLVVDGIEVAISEPVEIKEKFDDTILIESSSSINLTGAFFSTGFKTILRVEGIVEKWRPDINPIVSRDQDLNANLNYATSGRKRIVRYGTAYGLPDYLYLKVADAITMDELLIEGTEYTVYPDEKMEASEDVGGHPLYYYDVLMLPKESAKGKVFGSTGGPVVDSVVIVVDATAFGLPAGSLERIQIIKP